MTKKQLRKQFNPNFSKNPEKFFTDYEKYLEDKILEMEKENFKRYMRLQEKFIEDYKWLESQKVGHDLGQQACFDWINKNSSNFEELYWGDEKR